MCYETELNMIAITTVLSKHWETVKKFTQKESLPVMLLFKLLHHAGRSSNTIGIA